MRPLVSLTLLALALDGCSSPPTTGSPSSASPNGVQADDGAPGAVAGTIAQPQPANVPTEGPGLAVGERALALSLPDQHGKTRSLDEWLGKDRLVAVVFYRSADW